MRMVEIWRLSPFMGLPVTDVSLSCSYADCPDDFTYSAGGCHKVGTTNKDWENAAAGCRSMNENAHLLVIDNEAEQLAIVDMMGSINSSYHFFSYFVHYALCHVLLTIIPVKM